MSLRSLQQLLDLLHQLLTVKHRQNVVKQVILPSTRPIAHPITTMTRSLSPVYVRPTLVESGWDSSSFCLRPSRIRAKATKSSRRCSGATSPG
jgi:hypothetical protein